MATDPPTKESLCQLIIQFVQYQDIKLGKHVSEPVLTRLPVSPYCIRSLLICFKVDISIDAMLPGF